MVKKVLVALLAVTAAFVTAPVSAASPIYAAASVGRSTIDADAGAINNFGAATVGPTATSNSSNDVGLKLQLSYELNPTWSLEAGYTNLGEAKYITTNPTYTAGGVKKASLWNFDVVGKIPLSNRFSLLGRVGLYRWDTESDLPFAAGMGRVTENGFDFKFGVGAQYDFTRNFALRGEFERYNGIGKASTTGDSKVNLFSLGAVLKF